eukprot:gnl/Chilomastix_cuspidata/3031.p1 GENE.gnl/Chilomastix_cuspidata/3031~~gnl/Chilomastix_cuspidata/3031.p1  ORF type:complete len:1465 (-),score=201.32 gnl/Chilomastix_cuspidata/3031:4157-8527(-)
MVLLYLCCLFLSVFSLNTQKLLDANSYILQFDTSDHQYFFTYAVIDPCATLTISLNVISDNIGSIITEICKDELCSSTLFTLSGYTEKEITFRDVDSFVGSWYFKITGSEGTTAEFIAMASIILNSMEPPVTCDNKYNYLANDNMRYYRFFAHEKEEYFLQLFNCSGDSFIYVSRSGRRWEDPAPGRPGPRYALARSRSSIRLGRELLSFAPGWVYVGVYTASRPTSSTTLIVDRVPALAIQGHALAGASSTEIHTGSGWSKLFSIDLSQVPTDTSISLLATSNPGSARPPAGAASIIISPTTFSAENADNFYKISTSNALMLTAEEVGYYMAHFSPTMYVLLEPAAPAISSNSPFTAAGDAALYTVFAMCNTTTVHPNTRPTALAGASSQKDMPHRVLFDASDTPSLLEAATGADAQFDYALAVFPANNFPDNPSLTFGTDGEPGGAHLTPPAFRAREFANFSIEKKSVEAFLADADDRRTSEKVILAEVRKRGNAQAAAQVLGAVVFAINANVTYLLDTRPPHDFYYFKASASNASSGLVFLVEATSDFNGTIGVYASQNTQFPQTDVSWAAVGETRVQLTVDVSDGLRAGDVFFSINCSGEGSLSITFRKGAPLTDVLEGGEVRRGDLSSADQRFEYQFHCFDVADKPRVTFLSGIDADDLDERLYFNICINREYVSDVSTNCENFNRVTPSSPLKEFNFENNAESEFFITIYSDSDLLSDGFSVPFFLYGEGYEIIEDTFEGSIAALYADEPFLFYFRQSTGEDATIEVTHSDGLSASELLYVTVCSAYPPVNTTFPADICTSQIIDDQVNTIIIHRLYGDAVVTGDQWISFIPGHLEEGSAVNLALFIDEQFYADTIGETIVLSEGEKFFGSFTLPATWYTSDSLFVMKMSGSDAAVVCVDTHSHPEPPCLVDLLFNGSADEEAAHVSLPATTLNELGLDTDDDAYIYFTLVFSEPGDTLIKSLESPACSTTLVIDIVDAAAETVHNGHQEFSLEFNVEFPYLSYAYFSNTETTDGTIFLLPGIEDYLNPPNYFFSSPPFMLSFNDSEPAPQIDASSDFFSQMPGIQVVTFAAAVAAQSNNVYAVVQSTFGNSNNGDLYELFYTTDPSMAPLRMRLNSDLIIEHEGQGFSFVQYSHPSSTVFLEVSPCAGKPTAFTSLLTIFPSEELAECSYVTTSPPSDAEWGETFEVSLPLDGEESPTGTNYFINITHAPLVFDGSRFSAELFDNGQKNSPLILNSSVLLEEGSGQKSCISVKVVSAFPRGIETTHLEYSLRAVPEPSLPDYFFDASPSTACGFCNFGVSLISDEGADGGEWASYRVDDEDEFIFLTSNLDPSMLDFSNTISSTVLNNTFHINVVVRERFANGTCSTCSGYEPITLVLETTAPSSRLRWWEILLLILGLLLFATVVILGVLCAMRHRAQKYRYEILGDGELEKIQQTHECILGHDESTI